jgi:hypothetical protein
MSFPHPTDEEEIQLESECSDCKAGVDHWCRDDLEDKIRPMLHRMRGRQRDMQLGGRPKESGAKADEIPAAACRTCGHPAAYEVRDVDGMECTCPLHLFSTIAARLLGHDVVAVSLINKRVKSAERRELVEQAVQA